MSYVLFWIKYWYSELPHLCILFLITICKLKTSVLGGMEWRGRSLQPSFCVSPLRWTDRLPLQPPCFLKHPSVCLFSVTSFSSLISGLLSISHSLPPFSVGLSFNLHSISSLPISFDSFVFHCFVLPPSCWPVVSLIPSSSWQQVNVLILSYDKHRLYEY